MRDFEFEKYIDINECQPKTVPADQFLFNPGDRCDTYVYVRKGSVRVELLSTNGQQLLLYRIQGGQSCIMTTACLLGNNQYTAHAVTETEVELLLISQDTFRERLNDSPLFRDFVFDGFAERLASLMERIKELATLSIDQRLAAALLAAVDRFYPDKILMLTHDQLAVEIGTAREVISRRLADFEKHGALSRHRGAVEILNAEYLKQYLTAK